MIAVCKFVLGKKVDIPDNDESDVGKLRRELEELKASYARGQKESAIDVLWKEKEALQMGRAQCNEDDRLRREIDELHSRHEQRRAGDGSDKIAALRLWVQEMEKVRTVLEEKGTALSSLKAENSNLKKDLQNLKGAIDEIKGADKRSSDAVAETCSPTEPAKGKQRMVPIGDAVYTPNDFEALMKLHKEALADKEASDLVVQALKERMARMGAQLYSKQCTGARRSSVQKTNLRNLRPTLSAMQIDEDDFDGKDVPEEQQKTKPINEVVDNPEDI
ncbi:hypothetical protein CBR_g21174 [Chara braunii]|uniref:Uncharacterized protein n=1 Tax=Chara braunii TaxID=69332 RepID=A0A388L119_CHABU|nr:hypothetical protein CBR_g21174 [Chara braunii]|eukprot:GBG75932.1 hypothetical protein CBR_g21174 [Chara braunii]